MNGPFVGWSCACGAAWLLGCGSSSAPQAPAARVFTGTVDGSDAQVAVVATAHHARVYFCGGSSSYPVLTHWFTADVDAAGGVHPTASTGPAGWSLGGQIGSGAASGSVTIADGTNRAFHATPALATTIAGLYEAAAPCGKVGLIVTQPSGQSPAGLGACISADVLPSIEQVNPIEPVSRAVDGSIQVQLAGSAAEIAVRPAAPPAE